MAMVDVDGSSHLPAHSVGLVWGRAGSVCIHQMNSVNSRNGFGHDDSTTNGKNCPLTSRFLIQPDSSSLYTQLLVLVGNAQQMVRFLAHQWPEGL